MGMTVKLAGDQELIQQLQSIAAVVSGRQLMKALDAGAELLRDEMKKTDAFEDHTGKLRNSIVIKTHSKQRFEAQRNVGPYAPHSWLVEHGSKGGVVKPEGKEALKWGGRFSMRHTVPARRGRPFVRPAYDKNRQRIKDAIADELRAQVLGERR